MKALQLPIAQDEVEVHFPLVIQQIEAVIAELHAQAHLASIPAGPGRFHGVIPVIRTHREEFHRPATERSRRGFKERVDSPRNRIAAKRPPDALSGDLALAVENKEQRCPTR